MGSIKWTGADLGQEILEMGLKMDLGLAQIMKYEAQQGQNYMRTKAPWTDRTANARQGLFTKAYTDGVGGVARKSTYVIVAYHTVPYGIWLETRWSGKYRIIEPAIQHIGRNVMESANGLLRKLKGSL